MLIIPAILLIFMTLFHTILGEKYVLGPIKTSNTLPKLWGSKETTFRTIQATWHLVSALWFGLAATLLAIQFFPALSIRLFLVIFGFLFAVLSIVPFVMKAGEHRTWIIFGTISALLFWSAFNY